MSDRQYLQHIIDDVYRFKKLMYDNQLVLMYTDVITSQTLQNLSSITEEKLTAQNTKGRLKKKVFNVMMECVQNITRHGQKDEKSLVSSVFILGKDNQERFFIISGNNIAKEEMQPLKDRLDKLNDMDSEELHEHYLTVMDNGEISARGGAGLGFIDILRKSKSKIDYHFHPVEGDNLFFVFKVNIEN